MKWFTLIVRVVLSLAFLVAGFLKLRDPSLFAVQVHDFRLTPWWLSAGIAVYVPWLEIFAGLGVWIKRVAGGAWFLYMAMLTGFIAVLISAISRGLDVDCGCFGGGGDESDLGMGIIRNLLLLAGVAWCWMKDSRYAR